MRHSEGRRSAFSGLTIRPDHPFWPDGWKHLPDPPSEVLVSGKCDGLAGPCLGIVGTRKATPRGLAVAERLGAELGRAGWTIVSGLARGIDAAAHRGALGSGAVSVGVMATGPDRTYPSEHGPLRRELEVRGCTVTEYPPGVPPLKHHFPQRNRLLAGLCRAVIVVEAPLKSGAMLTADLALDYDREVFAVPGPVDLLTSRGCHHLIRQGAHLLESAVDVRHVLGHPRGVETGIDGTMAVGLLPPVAGSSARWILDRLDLEGCARDELRLRWPGDEAEWMEGLTALELAGWIRRLPGGRLARRIWSG